MLKNARVSMLLAALLIVALFVGAVGCGSTQDTADKGTAPEGSAEKGKIVFGDLPWETVGIHNRIAQFIIENGYGYETEAVVGQTTPLWVGLQRGEIDVYIETWIQQFEEPYAEGIDSGNVVDVGTLFDDNFQGIFVPTYMIKGDPERGIEPMAPDLRTVEDLKRYWELFKDPEDPAKGRFYGGVPGWDVNEDLDKQLKNYGLDKYYNQFHPGSTTAAETAMLTAYEKGEPWLGYFGGPNWIFGEISLTQIEEPAYSAELWADRACGWPSSDVNICVNKDLPDRAPDVVEFLSNYKTNADILNEALAYFRSEEATYEETAEWFLREKQDLWTQWVPEDVADKVREAL